MCERERQCVCVCVRDRDRVCVCVQGCRNTFALLPEVFVCVCMRERQCVCVRERDSVCVCERERDRVCVCVQGCRNTFALLPKVGRKSMDKSLLGNSQIAFCNDDFSVVAILMLPSMKLRCFLNKMCGGGGGGARGGDLGKYFSTSDKLFSLAAFGIH